MNDKSIVGKICSVYCEDFVTYEKGTIYPGEYLNVIIGPNGSGKSTLVAAIVLGLGGNPKLLSRSSNIDEYIKNGKEKAYIEIKIFKNLRREMILLGRTFDSKGKSIYTIDKTVVSYKEYLARIEKFNIQINNLCQFLPQDRVQDFAKMNPQEILMNTLASVCSQEMVENFEKLKNMRQEQYNSTKGLSQSLDKLKEMENRNALLKEQIERMEERKKLQHDIVLYESKKIWLEHEEVENNLSTTKIELEQATTILQKHKKNYESAVKNVQNIVNKKEEIEKSVKNEENKLRKISKEFDDLHNLSEQDENSISNAKSRLELKKREKLDREKDLSREIVLLDGLKADLKTAFDDYGIEQERRIKADELEKKLLQRKSEHNSLMETHRNINRKLDEQFTPELAAIKRKIASMENIGDRKLVNIRDNFDQVYKAINWLRQNRNLFEGQVYEPMLLELNINDSSNAKYIENVVNTRDLLAFTCENISDMNILVKNLCNDMGLKVSVIHSDAADECTFQPRQSIDDFRHLGFRSYLLDMLSGPAPILNYLCRIYNIHTILAGTEEVENHTNEIPKHIRMYFAGNNKITTMYSKYSGEKSTMRTEITERRLLSVGVDAKEINALKKKLLEISKNSDVLKNRRGDIEIQLNLLEEQRKELLAEKKIFERKAIVVEQLKERIKNQKYKIERFENNPIDIDAEEINFTNLTKNLVKKLLDLENKKVKTLSEYQKISDLYNVSYTKLQIYKRETANVEQQITDLKEAFNNSKQLVETIQSNVEKLEAKIRKIRKNTRDRCKGYIPTDKKFPFTKEFSELPNDLAELNDMVLEMQARVNCMLAENQSIYDEYQQRDIQINQLRSEIESNTMTATEMVNSMNMIHNQWFPQIMNVVETINLSFGRFMSSMDYVGEVQLCRNDEFDYDSYGIQIMVKYRSDARLQALDRFVQSGGERAVAIAVYTLSLQRLTNVPFRCVDEINQGMDANNERKIFDMLVDETSQPGHSQYFFITPKLLPNLNYNEYMTIHIVYNGSCVDNDHIFVNK